MNTSSRLHAVGAKMLFVILALLATFLFNTAAYAMDWWYGTANSTWDTTSGNWWTNAGGYNAPFVSGDPVDFAYTWAPLTVTIAGTGITTSGITFDAGGYNITGGAIALTGAATITANAGATISSNISSTQGLAFSGTGTLVLDGANTITGATTINGGILWAGINWSSLGAVTLANAAGAELIANYNNWQPGLSLASLSGGGSSGGNVDLMGDTLTVGSDNTSTTFAGQIISDNWGNGNIVKVGTGTLVLTNTSTYYGNTTVSGGVLSIASTGALQATYGVFTINTGATLQLNGGWGGFGPGGFNTGGNLNTQASSVVINGGTIDMASNYTDNGRNFTIGTNGATLSVESGVTWVLNTDRSWQNFGGGLITVTNATSLTLAGAGTGQMNIALAGTGSLTKNGSGTWTLTGTDTIYGNTTVSGGVLDITQCMLYGGSYSGPTITVNSGATLQLAGNSAFGWAGNPGIGNLDIGSGCLVVNGGTINFTGTSVTGGGRDFSIGTLGATLQSSQSGGVLTISGGYTGIVTNNSSLTLAGNGSGGAVLQSNVTGSGSLIKNGSGIWTLSGSNNYTGSTTVSSGTLCVNGVIGSTAALTVASGAALSGTGTIASAVSISNGATVTLGDGNGNHGTLTLTGTLAVAGGATLNFGLGSVGTSDLIHLTGAYVAPSGSATVNLASLQNFLNAQYGMSGGTYSLITGAAGISAGNYALGSTPTGYACALSASNGTLSVTVTPLNAPIGLLGTAPATSGSVFNYQISLVSSPTGYAATGLPAGLSLNASTGVISGTATTPGIYYAMVSATNSGGVATSQLLIAVPPATPFVQSSNNPPALLSSSGGNMTVQPVLDNTLLINPGKGFAEYNGPSVYTASLIGVGYSRCDWVDVEPSEGAPNWAPISNLINAYAPYGLKIGYRVINVDAYEGRQYSTPPWVFQSGTNPVTHTVYPVGAAQMSIPDSTSPSGTHVIAASWEDPVYVARMKEFITAFGSQYNGNVNIAYLDLGNYGENGEGNGTFTTGLTNVTPAQLQTDFEQPYFTAFPNTQLIVNGGDWMYGNIFEWAVTQGAGRRTDGICYGVGNGSQCLIAYPQHPAVMEYWASYADTVAAGYGDPGTLMTFITGGRPSYLQFQPDFYNAYPAFCQMAGNLIGYHFVIQQATIPTSIQANVQFPMSLTWLNNGVAPLNLSGTAPCNVAIALLDGSNNVSQKQWLTTSNPKGWMPGVATTENYNVTFPSVPAGYRLAVGLFVNKTDANPTYRLGIQGRTVTGWYILTGTVNQVAATWTNASGGSWQTAGNWTGSSVRNGIDATADFSTLNLTSNATLTLDGNVTAGNLLFGDTTPSNNWILNTGTGGGVLTLRTSPNALTPGITVTNGTATINAGITGFMGQGLTKSGTGRLVLNGTNTFLGNTTVNAGILEVTTNTSLYTAWAGGAVTINTGGTLQLDGWVGYSGPGTGDINQSDASVPANLLINGGALAFVNVWGWSQASPRALSIGTSGATLMNSSTNSGLWQLSLGGNATQDTVLNNSSLTLNGAAGTTSQIDKVIAGTGSLTKSGAGTWTLTGSNNYTGSTTVSAGTLTLSGSITSTASVSIASGATMNVTGKLYATGNITNSGTMIFSGASPLFGAGGTITNNGTIINNSPSLALPTIVNNGTILSVPPSPWTRADIGTVGITGSATYLTGTYTVMGGGAGITSSSDAFCYTYQTSSSDCSVVARVASITNTNASAKGGVMIRSTTAANSMEAGVWVTPSSGIIFTYRTTTGGTTTTSSSTGKTAPYWVKITRTGNSFAGYYSTNGTSWTQLGSTQTISMGTSATIGLGVTSNVSGTLCTSKIDNVTATP